jgi:murein DD-endopeptidase MepM/ murein hydrolase activator NlpD
VVVYRVGPTSRRDGVGVGEWWFPGQALPGGGPQDRFALYGVPYDHEDLGAIRLLTEDDVGNRAELPVLRDLARAPASADTIEITDDFVAKVSADILPRAPDLKAGGDPVATFLAINRDLRRANAETLVELARESAPRFLFTAPFLPLPRAKVMSAFADRRAYRYLGREIDQQTHLGFDLASTRRTAVPAANDGMVVLARYLGIYGQTVVVDHGVGLMSLYAHLSSLEVAQGQAVARGDVLGRTGATGLAGGDHLHFTMLVRGLPVDPKEWWDRRFVAERIAGPLGPAVLPFGAAPRPAPAMD